MLWKLSTWWSMINDKPYMTWNRSGHQSSPTGSNCNSSLRLSRRCCSIGGRHGLLTTTMPRSVYWSYTILMGMVQNVSWRDHVINIQLYDRMSLVSEKIRPRRLNLTDHCHRHSEQSASMFVIWEPTHGRSKPRGPAKIMLKNIKDAGGGI